MSQSFFLRSIDSDLSVGGALFNRKLLDATAGAASQEVATGASAIIDGYAFTEPGVPGTDGGNGAADYTVSIHITSGATQINVSSRVARVDSSGTVQAESGFSTPDAGNAGIKVHDLTNVDLGTWAEGDRLRVQYRFENTDSMMARSLTIEKNTVETEVITPWEGDAEPPSEGSGSVTAQGSLSGTGQTDQAVGTLIQRDTADHPCGTTSPTSNSRDLAGSTATPDTVVSIVPEGGVFTARFRFTTDELGEASEWTGDWRAQLDVVTASDDLTYRVRWLRFSSGCVEQAALAQSESDFSGTGLRVATRTGSLGTADATDRLQLEIRAHHQRPQQTSPLPQQQHQWCSRYQMLRGHPCAAGTRWRSTNPTSNSLRPH